MKKRFDNHNNYLFNSNSSELNIKLGQSPVYFRSTPNRFLGIKKAIYLLLPLIGMGMTLLGSCSAPQQRNSTTVEQPSQQSDRLLTATPEDTNFVVEVVEKVEPAVVQITIARTIETQIPEIFKDPFFRRFFGDALPIPPQEREVRGIGSGFIINSNGQILTNAHVVDKADRVTVVLHDGRSFEGEVLGTDSVTDLAVVQIQAENLPTVEFGDSDQVRSGQWAIAIGSPLGLQQTVTVGVVSGLDRSSNLIGVSDKRIDFIQTDAAINPGNSGGPLLNARGQVIGVNTAIVEGAEGLGFAIPINTAREIAQQLITQGNVEHPYVGIQMITLTPEIRQQINQNPDIRTRIEADQGVLIARVLSDSPAAQAGLRPGDVIQQIDEQAIANAEEVQQLVEQAGVGGQLQVQVQRQGQTLSFTLQPEPLPVRDE
ncbi:trypsin-like peptidase domain-containing protein [Pleurocapsales cyanobacterium LEGE 06147]|nr:trypsin-like peptidase domain-containing protein [Pleurocapsales cyanobacterium LEGE 06147]